ncbi:MAG TPA: protein-disulfide reductase DsbD domain-containing protein [Steroidobacteraceae bacterium]|nr:protein-disulfide reductase DsbD domain-containing protein [Steroidobacteraceae bacterium]
MSVFRSTAFPTVILLSLLAGAAQAKPWWMRGIDSKETDFLPPDVAFRVSARVDGNLVKVRWVIADGYYLYRQKIDVRAESPDLVVSTAQLPAGVLKTDPYLGTQQIFTQQVEASVPYSRLDAGAHPMQIKVTYQGCAEAGLCYPPITKVLFPTAAPPPAAADVPPYPWESLAIIAGGVAFLLAGLVLRKGRKLDIPA